MFCKYSWDILHIWFISFEFTYNILKTIYNTLKSLKKFYTSYSETSNETLNFVSPRFLVTAVTPDIYINDILDMGICAIDQSQLHGLKEPLSRPAGALFEVGSGQKCSTGDDSW